MRDLARTNLFTRFIKKDRIKDKITDFELQLIDAVSQFQVCFNLFSEHSDVIHDTSAPCSLNSST